MYLFLEIDLGQFLKINKGNVIAIGYSWIVENGKPNIIILTPYLFLLLIVIGLSYIEICQCYLRAT